MSGICTAHDKGVPNTVSELPIGIYAGGLTRNKRGARYRKYIYPQYGYNTRTVAFGFLF